MTMRSSRILLSFSSWKWKSLCFVVFGYAVLAAMPQAVAQNFFFVPPAGAAGDFDGSGFVDAGDLPVWETSFGVADGGDTNGDGDSDGADFLVWQRNLGLSSAPVGDWENPNLWFSGGEPVGLPGQFNGSIIHANRTANVTSDVGSVAEIRIGDTVAPTPTGGTLNINAGGKVTSLGEILMGASNPGQFKEGELNVQGGELVSFGTMFVAFEPGATQTVNIGPGSLLDLNADLFGRFGTAIINQTGGIVDVQNNVIWGEGGDDDGLGEMFITRSEYNLSGGELVVGDTLGIGGSIGFAAPDSDGRVNVTGGMVSAGNLVFDTFPGEEAILNIEGAGVVRIDQANYSEAFAFSDIADGFIIGDNLSVSTVVDGGVTFTQIESLGPLGAVTFVPEPSAALLSMFAACGIYSLCRRAVSGCRSC